MNTSKILKIFTICRHGHRAPLIIPPEYKNHWQNPSYLTLYGSKNQYKNGQNLYERHLDFFNQKNPPKINVFSSNLQRTICSAYYFINGILGNNKFSEIQNIKTENAIKFLKKYGLSLKPQNKDFLFRSFHTEVSPASMNIYKEILKNAYKTRIYFPEIHEITKKAHNIWDFDLTKPADYFGCFYLYDFMDLYVKHNMKIPEKYDIGIYEKLDKFIHYLFVHDLMMNFEIVRKLANHVLFKKIIEISQNASFDNKKEFYYFSSHDTNLFGVLKGLGYNPSKVPELSSHVTIKIYEKIANLPNKSHFVDVEFKGKNINLQIAKKSEISLPEFLQILQKGCFKNDTEFGKISGNPNFDYIRDYENIKEMEIDENEIESLRKFKAE